MRKIILLSISEFSKNRKLLEKFGAGQQLTNFFDCRKIKVWDLQAALDPRSPNGTLCLRTLVVSKVAY